MKRSICIVLVLTLTFCLDVTVNAGQRLYVAIQNPGRVVAYDIDSDSGTLTEVQKLPLPGNPGPMVVSPDQTKIYVAVSTRERKKITPGVSTINLAADGKIGLAKTVPAPNRVCYLSTDKQGKYLYGSDYGAGQICVMNINGGIADNVLQVVTTEKKTHSTPVDPSGKFLFVPHTGPNAIYQYIIDAKTGKLKPNTPATVSGTQEDGKNNEPRHLIFHPTLETVAYNSNEAGGGISRWDFDTKNGTLTLKESHNTVPSSFEGRMTSADIRITPNGKFVYVSNRDNTKGKKNNFEDSIAGFKTDSKTGSLTLASITPTERIPRTFDIDKTGKFMYVGGQKSGSMTAYKIDQKSGELEKIASYETAKSPIWIMSIQLD